MSRFALKAAQTQPPKYPPPLNVNGRLYNWHSHIEWYKEALVAHALGQDPPPMPTTRPEGDSLIPVKTTAAQLGVGRRTIGRRIKEAVSAATAATVAA
jgi:hypothetical protein